MAEESQHEEPLLPLIGTEDSNVDDKGRIPLGTKLRTRLGSKFAVYLGENDQVIALPERTWKTMSGDLMKLDQRLKPREDYGRDLFGMADDDQNFDGQGRWVIPTKLRKAAQIGNKAKIIGNGNFMEIWSPDAYDVYMLKLGNRETRMRESRAHLIDPTRYRLVEAINSLGE